MANIQNEELRKLQELDSKLLLSAEVEVVEESGEAKLDELLSLEVAKQSPKIDPLPLFDIAETPRQKSGLTKAEVAEAFLSI